jgi:hypothetical protein
MVSRLWGLGIILGSLLVSLLTAHLGGVRHSPTIHAICSSLNRVLPGWLSEVLMARLFLRDQDFEVLGRWYPRLMLAMWIPLFLVMLGFAFAGLGLVIFGERGW